ncbi:MAG TPA: cysteine peptidase family C39 domain-containing protein [Polyangia bacterium]|jgi:ABC-type bacteriocin/lantibiotic exporter with double-glycine peptidase domain
MKVCPGAARSAGLVLVAAAALGLTGCLYRGGAHDLDPGRLAREPGWIAVHGVPERLQKSEQDCGAAVISMVLTYWGVPTTIDDVLRIYPVTKKHGLKAGDLREYARRRGLVAFVFRGDLDDLERELGHGRPVVVGVVKPYVGVKAPHYEVVVGYNPSRGLVATLDPGRGWRQNTVKGFLAEWDRSQRLVLLVLRPATMSQAPPRPQPPR